nr:hypothetical protein [uncultured Flavobacterium sp.]
MRGAAGDLIQIEVNGVLKKPSELDVTDLKQTKTLIKVAIFLAAKNGAPHGSRFGTGTKSSDLASKNPAFTVGISPYFTIFNHHGGSFSTDLDNIYSFTNIIQHELRHQSNFNHNIANNLSNHVDIYINSFSYISFAKSPPSYQLSVVKSLANYILAMDKNKVNDYKPYKTQEKIDDYNNLHLSYRIEVPISYNQGELTISIRDNQSNQSPIPYIYIPIKNEN